MGSASLVYDVEFSRAHLGPRVCMAAARRGALQVAARGLGHLVTPKSSISLYFSVI